MYVCVDVCVPDSAYLCLSYVFCAALDYSYPDHILPFLTLVRQCLLSTLQARPGMCPECKCPVEAAQGKAIAEELAFLFPRDGLVESVGHGLGGEERGLFTSLFGISCTSKHILCAPRC
jgi:hypothetical protein